MCGQIFNKIPSEIKDNRVIYKKAKIYGWLAEPWWLQC